MKGRPNEYLPQELAWIEARKELPRRETHALFCAYWKRDDVTLTAFNGLCKRMGWMTGRTGCFERGLTPHDHPNCRATRFKKGDAPANVTPMWTERIDGDGYVEWKVPEPNPHTGHKTRYRRKHLWLWEQVNGQVPEGHVLKSLDGDRRNTDPANWEAVPRAILPRLAGGRHKRTLPYDSAPDELKTAIMATAKLAHRAREMRRTER